MIWTKDWVPIYIPWAQTCCDSGQLSCVQLLWDYLVKRDTRLAVWRACSHNDGWASKWCWKMRRAVIIFTIDTGGKAGRQTSRALMHLIMAGSSTSAPQEHNLHLIMLDYRIRGWFWTAHFPCGISVLCPQCCAKFNLKRPLKKPPNVGADLTADLSHWNLSDVCGPVCRWQIPKSTETKSVCFPIRD